MRKRRNIPTSSEDVVEVMVNHGARKVEEGAKSSRVNPS